MRPYLTQVVNLKRSEALGKLAAQVAHDIQSPLAALANVVQNSKGLPQNQNQLLKSASSRIQSIADDLLTRYKDPELKVEHQFTLVSAVVNSIVAEKTAVLGDQPSIEIRTSIAPEALTVGVPISGTSLSRVLSNLMNNSLYWTQNHAKGLIQVTVKKENSFVSIQVEDNGKGMSPDILYKVRTVGGTYRSDGAGIGLQVVKETVIEARGQIEIDSELGKGTKVTLKIPVAVTPPWCPTELRFPSEMKIVVLDDNPSVHLVWEQRLTSFRVFYFHDPKEIDFSLFNPEECRFIFDYEISGSNLTGLDLIKKHGLAHYSVLVTSYFNDPKIQKEIAEVGSKILPKFLIPSISIQSEQPIRIGEDQLAPDLILIDDDVVIHRLWKIGAELANKRILAVFNDGAISWGTVPRHIPIYVDRNLAHGISGLKVAERLHDQGFNRIILTTGSSSVSVGKVPYVSEIIGKEFPSL